MGHYITGQYPQWEKNRSTVECGWYHHKCIHTREYCSRTARVGNHNRRPCGWRCVKLPKAKNRFKAQDLFADMYQMENTVGLGRKLILSSSLFPFLAPASLLIVIDRWDV